MKMVKVKNFPNVYTSLGIICADTPGNCTVRSNILKSTLTPDTFMHSLNSYLKLTRSCYVA